MHGSGSGTIQPGFACQIILKPDLTPKARPNYKIIEMDKPLAFLKNFGPKTTKVAGLSLR
jgi:hypothetical protein